MYKKYRIVTSLVLVMSSFVFAQDVTSKVNLRLNIIDKMSFSIYCGLSHVFDNGNRSKCSSDSLQPVVPIVMVAPTDIPIPVEVTPVPVTVMTSTTTAAQVAVNTNPVLEEIQKKIAENSAAISELQDKTSALESRGTGQTIVKYISSGSRGPKGADGVTTIVYATPTPSTLNNMSGSILIGQNNSSFAANTISIGRDIVNNIDGSIQIGANDMAKVTLISGTSSNNMTMNVPGRIIATSFCIADICIDADMIRKISDTFK